MTQESKPVIEEEYKTITEEMINIWRAGTFDDNLLSYVLDILRGDYDLNEARSDVLTFKDSYVPIAIREVKGD